MKSRIYGIALATVSLSLASCEFGEIAIPDGEPMVVVHAIMRSDLDRQWVLVEQTLTGRESVEDSTEGAIPGSPSHLPVSSALVTVTNLSQPNDPCGVTSFTETPGDPDLETGLGLYWGPTNCPAMNTGDSLELRVETADGIVVTGRLEIAGVDEMMLRAGSNSITLPGPTLQLNRDTDTLVAEVSGAEGRALQVEVSVFDSTDVIEPVFWMVLDTTRMSIPGKMLDFFDELFEDDEDTSSSNSPAQVFTAGRHHAVTVAFLDDMYFDFMRSANMEISGRGFINNLEGGMGVFGNMVALTNEVRVVGEMDDAREGYYNLVGDISGTAVDVDLELYVAIAEEDTTDMAAFADGDWLLGNLDTSVSGVFQGNSLALTIYQVDPTNSDSVSAVLLTGTMSPGGAFSMNAYDRSLAGIGSVTVTSVSPLESVRNNRK